MRLARDPGWKQIADDAWRLERDEYAVELSRATAEDAADRYTMTVYRGPRVLFDELTQATANRDWAMNGAENLLADVMEALADQPADEHE
ncbi:MAG: hypothetical protein M3N29_01780 [Chloroflexota bacterium]|nr:hypothetical protein [Chloroflexota bacterium]